MMSLLRQHECVRGVFRPKRRYDLRLGAADHIGREIEFYVAWRIEEGEYTGQWALSSMELLDPPLGWVPEEDVEIIGRPTL